MTDAVVPDQLDPIADAASEAGLYSGLISGATLGLYTLVAPISTSGMEQIWSAKETGSTAVSRPLTLTIVHAAAHGSHEALANFRHRATALAKLRHDGIERGFEPQLIAGMDVVVSAASADPSLDIWLSEKQETIPVLQARELILQLCDALAAAMDLAAPHGPLEHRQLRPDQIRVVETGGTVTLRVGGFGLAADTARPSWSPEARGSDSECYYAPEQISGQAAANLSAAMVFSLGVISVELLTLRMRPALGRCWWELAGDSDEATVAALAELRTQVPIPVLKALAGAMLSDPVARYSSVRAFMTAFDASWPEPRLKQFEAAQAAAATARTAARAKPPAPAKPLPAARSNARLAGAIGALALTAAAAIFALRSSEPPAASATAGSGSAAAAATAAADSQGGAAAAAGGSGAQGGAEGSATAPQGPLLPMVNRQLGQLCTQPTQCGSGLCSNGHCAPEGFAYIPAGSFTRGTPTAELGHKSDEWQVEVEIGHPFFLQIAEVSQRDWRAVMGTNPSVFSACGDGCPVDNISWWQGLAYLNARSLKESLTECYTVTGCTGDAKQVVGKPDGSHPYSCESATLQESCTGYRYPTEVEWEYAARAKTTTATYRANIRTDSSRGFACAPEAALDGIAVWYCVADATYGSGVSGAGHNGPASIGPSLARRRSPNPFGLYDMLGNVSEWTDSGYINSPMEPLPVTAGAVDSRVARGGSWFDPPLDLRAGARSHFDARTTSRQRGFRPAIRLTIPDDHKK